MGMFERIKCSSKMRINLPITGLLFLSNPPHQDRDEIPILKEDLTTRPPLLIHVPWGMCKEGRPA